jgi:predicted acylesterase/phospholipase RssA
MQRAIALGGGGPAAGLHIGVLEGLAAANPKMKFDVWALSCIGAWVGIVYNQAEEGKELEQTYDFFKNGVFRDDVSYSRFPVNTVFGPDWFGNARALTAFMADPDNYKELWLPDRIMDAYKETISLLTDRAKWNEGDFNQWVLNHAFAANPFIRYLSSMMYLSNVTGLSRIYYPESTFMKAIKFERLYEKRKPTIIHNAWNLSKQKLELFSNRGSKYKPITPASLCACSALPFIEETVDIDGDTYCEGALVDTVNFKSLIDDFGKDLHEIWISRIVDAKQVREPENLHDNLANLCQLFAATVGEDDVNLFKYHVKEDKTWKGTIVEIQVRSDIDFTWSHANLDKGRSGGFAAAKEAYEVYMRETGGKKNTTGEVRIINEKKKDPDD